jgi:trk system potassium uptake protein TrkA
MNLLRALLLVVLAAAPSLAQEVTKDAHGNKDESQVVGRKIEEVDLPKGSAIVALVRNDQVIIAHHDTVIETDDHVILFMTDRRKIEQIEALFQVGVSFV